MGFSFDFTGERNVIVYQAEAGMVLDENIYRLLRSELMEEYILSFETENTSRECRFYYDITGCTNMRAWMGEHGFLEKRKMKKKIEEMQKLLTRNGIPKEMIEQEMQYMFVNDEDEEVRLVCIPLRENTYMETKRGKAEDSGLPPLPKEIPVPPENGAGFQNYTGPAVQKKPEMDSRNEVSRNTENWNTEDWNAQEELYVPQKKHFSHHTENSQHMEHLQDIEPLQDIESVDQRFFREESFAKEDSEFQREEPVQHFEKPADRDDEEEDGTVLLYDPDDEGTVLLKVPPKINARLIRRNTGEEFVINKERTKIGKKAAVVDICIQGNKTISREHCIITFEEGVFFLEDCHSLNHTYLNKTELEPEIPVRLETDSEIQMSDELFDFIIEEG